MKLAEFRRLSFVLRIKVGLAYIGDKLLHKKLIRQQDELLYYFRHLVKMKAFHSKDLGKYFLITSPEYGKFYMRKPFSSDYKVFRQVFADEEYLPVAQLIDENCKGDTVVMIDGGANIGLTTVYMHHFLKNKKQLVSILVEPFAENLESARLNLSSQGVVNVFYEKAGLHNKKCFLKIVQGFSDGKEWAVQVKETSDKTDLESIQITEILDKYNLTIIDILKLDIEGAERFLFEDENYAAGFLKKVRIIAVELHREYNLEGRIPEIFKMNDFEVVKVKHTYIGVKKIQQAG